VTDFASAGRRACLLAALLAGGCAGLQPVRMAAPDPGAVAALNRFMPSECNGTLASVLAGARIPVSQVSGLTYGVVYGELTDAIIRHEAWVSLTGQPGAAVVVMDRYCQPTQIYTRGGARLPA